MRLRHDGVGFLQVGLDFLIDLFLRQVSIGDGLGVVVLGKVGDALEYSVQVEPEPGTEGLQLAQHGLLVSNVGTLDGLHGLVDTSYAEVVVLPLVQTGGVVADDVGNFQLVDVGFHRDAFAALIGIVAAHVEHPVGDRAGKSGIVVIEEVGLQAMIGRGHQAFDGVFVNLFYSELTLWLQVKLAVAGCKTDHDAYGTDYNIFCFHIVCFF